jgi:lycopene cyclase-like protein
MASSEMRLMDFTTAHLCPDERSGPPTFLYAMTLKDGRYFLEETSLAAAPGMKQRVLEDRLAQRMAYHGWRARRVLHTERVHFPMNLPLPALDQPFLAYGAAASLVHPASGYQVGAALRLAPYVAQAVVDALNAPGASPKTAAAAGYQAIWPAQRLRKRALYAFGLRRLMSFNAPTTQAFFEAFFALPQPLWAGYLSDSLSLSQILQVMTQVFRHAPAELKRRLLVGR